MYDECTFCADCVDNILFNVCPNCGARFSPRPIRLVDGRYPGQLPLTSTERDVMEFWVSALAATLTTGAFVPQALHIIRHKETKAISLIMYLAFACGVALWFWFGMMIHNWPVIISNAITFALTAAIVTMKLRYR